MLDQLADLQNKVQAVDITLGIMQLYVCLTISCYYFVTGADVGRNEQNLDHEGEIIPSSTKFFPIPISSQIGFVACFFLTVHISRRYPVVILYTLKSVPLGCFVIQPCISITGQSD